MAAASSKASRKSRNSFPKPENTALRNLGPAGMVLIRVGEAADKEPVRALMKRFHGDTVFGHLPFSDAKYDRNADTVLKKPPHMVALVAEWHRPDDAKQIIGLAWATAGSYALSDEGVMATCHVIAIDRDAVLDPEKGSTLGDKMRQAKTFLRLIKALKAWAKTRGAGQVLIHVTTGTKEGGIDARTTGRLLAKAGATAIGGGYVV